MGFAYFLDFLWITTAGWISYFIFLRHGHNWSPLPANFGTQIVQLIIAVTEFGVMGTIAIVAARARKRQTHGTSWNDVWDASY